MDKITIATTLELDKDGNKDQKPPAGLKLLAQERTGVLLFDTAAGRVVRSQATQKLTTERPYRDLKIRVETTASSVMTIKTQ